MDGIPLGIAIIVPGTIFSALLFMGIAVGAILFGAS